MTDLATTRKLPLYAQDPDRPYDGDPWTRQRHETARQYEAFQLYLGMDKRTYAGCDRLYCEKHGLKINVSRISTWAKNHRWQERALAYDNFMTAAQVAANKRALVKRSAEHAAQAQAVQDILMRPVDEYRRRMEEQGIDLVAGLSDEQVLKMAVAFGRELPTMQKAEREALSATSDTVVPHAEIKAKGEIVRRMLADGTVRELAERVQFEVTSPLKDQTADD